MKRLTPDEVILGLLRLQPAHGYQLLERFQSKAHLGRIWTMSTSQLYAVLKRLEDEGAIKGKRVEMLDAPSRIDYSITEVGEARLMAWLYDPQSPISIHEIRVMFLSRLYIASKLGMPVNEILAYQEEACIKQREKFFAERLTIAAPVEKLAVEFVIGQLEAALAWIKNVE